MSEGLEVYKHLLREFTKAAADELQSGLDSKELLGASRLPAAAFHGVHPKGVELLAAALLVGLRARDPAARGLRRCRSAVGSPPTGSTLSRRICSGRRVTKRSY